MAKQGAHTLDGIIKYRVSQDANTVASDANVTIYAPLWVNDALKMLSPLFMGKKFEIEGSELVWEINSELTLIDLVVLARNERANTNGKIKFEHYESFLPASFDLKNPKAPFPSEVLSLKDLVKHCVIVGKDKAQSYGGYASWPKESPIVKIEPPCDVYICDLSALPFLQAYNAGRHVIISPDDSLPKTTLDSFIFESTVGMKKASYQQAQAEQSGRYYATLFKDNPALFDTLAYQSFVAQDFLLAILAVNQQANQATPKDNIHFKFLKYGTTFFLTGLGDFKLDEDPIKKVVSKSLLLGIKQGLTEFFKLPQALRTQIKAIELPNFYDENDQESIRLLSEIHELCLESDIAFLTTDDDPLKPRPGLVCATTNRADPNVMPGNEMQYGSTDGALAENVLQHENNLSPLCNEQINAAFIEVPHLPKAQKGIEDNFAGQALVHAYKLPNQSKQEKLDAKEENKRLKYKI